VRGKLKGRERKYFSLKMILLQTGVAYFVGFEILETQSGPIKIKVKDTFTK
jgi:hypothetical protein